MEAAYRAMRGVVEVVPGYMGGTVPQPSHEMVATGTTGHAEVVKVIYDESIISTEDILNVFFALHDPAVPNHPPLGIGSQYRVVIFYTEDIDGEAAAMGNGGGVGVIGQVIARVQATMPEGVSVSAEAISAQEFYAADESHYDYYNQHKDDDYCVTVICPKIEAIQAQFPDKFFITT